MIRNRWVWAAFSLVIVAAGSVAYVAWPRTEAPPLSAFDRGLLALHEGDEVALSEAVIALEADEENAAHQAFLRGAWAMREARWQDALEFMRKASAHPDLRTRAMILGGQAFYQAGHAADAQRMWTAVLEEQPDAIDAHRWLGALYYDVGAMVDALKHLARVSELAPGDPRPDRLMGLINKDYERFDLAVKHYRETLRRDPDQAARVDVLHELAESQIKLHDYAGALDTLSDCPDDAVKFARQADCYYSLGRPDDAHAALEHALQLDPQLLPALVLQATLWTEQGEPQQALVALQQAVAAQPFDYQARFQLAQTLRRLDRQDEAKAESAAAEQLRERWGRFSELHQQAIREPANAQLREEIGLLAEQLGRPDLAVGWYRAALAVDPQLQSAGERLQTLDSRNPISPPDTHGQ